MANGKNPVKTMIEIQNYAAQLRSMGATIEEEAEVARTISSLQEEKYRQFREAWRSVDASKQTTALLMARLKTWELEEEANKAANQEIPENQSQKAYSAHRKGGRPRKTKEEYAELKKKTRCHICKKLGHWKSECPEKNKQKGKRR